METKEFETWVQRLRPSLLSAAGRMLDDDDEAEDAVQDALLKLWLIRHRLALYRSPDALAAVVVKNLCLSRLRERGGKALPLTEGMEVRGGPMPDGLLEEREDRTWLARTIRGLPSAQMTILRMSQTEGMSNRQIAAVMGIAETSVRTALCKARHKLLEEMKRRFNS